jgi:tetratricopeptide (TPR) repeat protein
MNLLCTRLRWVWLLLLLCWLALPVQAAPATAAEPADDGCLTEAECRDHYQRAIGLYESGRYEAALPEFQAAYQSRQMPWLLINIGRTLHRLGRLDEAITFYNRYEQAVPGSDADTLKKVREYKAQAEVLLSAKGTKVKAPADTTPHVGVGVDKGPPGAAQPLYKKWWFWTAIGGGVVLALAIGIGAGVAANGRAPIPMGTTVYVPTF